MMFRQERSTEVKEKNVERKKYRKGQLKVAIAYPSTYEVAISSLVFHSLYKLLAKEPWIYVERFVLSRLSGDEPPLKSLETGDLLRNFDVVLVSVNYEPNYVNVVRLLKAGGVSPQRKGREGPIVIAGGSPLMANPFPLHGIVDAVFIGEFEDAIFEVLDRIDPSNRRRSLEDLAELDYMFVPEIKEYATRHYVKNLDEAFHPTDQVVPLNREPVFGKSLLVEVNRGCPWRCAFCMETRVTCPKRDRSLAALLRIISEGMKRTGYRKVALISLSLADYPTLGKLLSAMYEQGLELSIPSIRAERVGEHELELVSKMGQRTLTIAPETGSQRIASAIGKSITAEDVIEAVKRGLKAGFTKVKMYIITGFPGETNEDFKRTLDLAREVARILGDPRKLHLSVNVLIPKPQTPLQYAEVISRKEYEARRKDLQSLKPAQVDVMDYQWATIQYQLALAGPKASEALILWAELGAKASKWKAALRELGVKSLIDSSEPWRNINHGFPYDKLMKEYEEFISKVAG